MITDFHSLDNDNDLDVDLCIVGAGAAGITLAREFIDTNINVCVVESGGYDFDTATQDMYEGDIVGLPYFPLDETRLRYLGGSTNHWGGFCGPFDDVDFKKRSWVPLSGWPISKSQALPYYERAQTICRLGPFIYDKRVWDEVGIAPPEIDTSLLAYDFVQRSDVAFGSVYRDELKQADNIRVLLNANVVDIVTDANGAVVERLALRSLDGMSGSVSARRFVLACGGLENPRILLSANSIRPNGLGNDNDLVGRHFMEHLYVHIGFISTDDSYGFLDDFASNWMPVPAWQTRVHSRICMLEKAQSALKTMNSCVNFGHVFVDPEDGTKAALEIWDDVRVGSMPDDLAHKVWRIVKDIDGVAEAAYRKLIEGKRAVPRAAQVGMSIMSEQAPNRDSRVTLTNDRDALGMPRIALDWRVSDVDRHTIETMAHTMAREIGRLNMGRAKLEDWVVGGSGDWTEKLHGGNHHIGTTRMADDPNKGVVDRHCRVHGISNLFIAGSSVFPTSGAINPTLTIVAMSLRLADHLKHDFGTASRL